MNKQGHENVTVTSSVDTAIGDLNDAIPNPPAWLVEALTVPREEGFVAVDGCNLRYFRWGDKSKPGILMTHGFLAHARCFAFIAPYLAADYHVVAFDMSGMGDSAAHAEYSEALRVAELVGVAQQTGLCEAGKKPTIVAHSFGGSVGTAAVYAHPDLFAGLIICDLMIIRPSVLEQDPKKFAPPGKRDKQRPNRIYPDYAAAKQRFVLSPPQPTEQQVLFDFMAYHSVKQVASGWTWKFDPSVFSHGIDASKKRLGIGERVLLAPGRKAIIYGGESLLFTPDSVSYMNELAATHGREQIPMIDIPHARHHLMLDQPIAFVAALKSVHAFWGH